MSQINIVLQDSELRAALDALPQTIFKAQRSAIRTTATWTGKELRKRMRDRTGFPAKVFNKFRVKTKRNRETGTVWIGLNKVKASYVGKLSNDTKGAWAGDYYFEGGFIAKMRSGHVGIFKRINSDRSSIVEQSVELPFGFEVAEDVAQAAQEQLHARFLEKIQQFNTGVDY